MGRVRLTKPLIGIALAALAATAMVPVVGGAASGEDGLDGGAQDRHHVEVLTAVLAVSRMSYSLAEAGAVESNAGMTRESVVASRGAIAGYKDELRQHLELLEGKGYDDRVSRVSAGVEALIANVDEIENSRPDLLRAMLAGEQSRRDLVLDVGRKLIAATTRSLDDQFYYIATGRSDSRDEDVDAAEALTEEEVLRHSHTSTLFESLTNAYYTLLIAATLKEPTLVTNTQESFESGAQRMRKSLEYLAENGGPELHPSVVPLSEELMNAGAGQDNFFDALTTRLGMAETERELIAANALILDSLQAEIDALAQDVAHTAAQ